MRDELELAVARDLRTGPRVAPRILVVGLAAVALIAAGLALPSRFHVSDVGTPTARASVEQRLRGLAVVHGSGGDALDTAQAMILGSSQAAAGPVYLVAGIWLVSETTSQCVGVLAPRAFDDSFARLPNSDLFFGDYSCGMGGSGGGYGMVPLGSDAIAIYATTVEGVTRVSLVLPSGDVDLALRGRYFGGVVTRSQSPPTRIVERNAAGDVVKTWQLAPQSFLPGRRAPDSTSPHRTLVADELPDGRDHGGANGR